MFAEIHHEIDYVIAPFTLQRIEEGQKHIYNGSLFAVSHFI
ncbi:hypothetical protein [Paraglaciecola agarilytica]|jgi:hypothetical protein|uniref:Uncharacterized protein n=2 Tax=Paraglaciecola chathamensis TaxID=368405 RepID=A0ABQ0I486_9ALTE|nr:hypothetical protein [Paraglaciecola agarilytica]GAC04097.1 hypothetical protein GAGA_1239 [Paraglaciecola agarilytica NO2]GAC10197.1 hypothetical protein GCHA_2247 [Paraglaciecola chathamensis S18K6]|tara:strand:- start:174347 stop:174469 length:123 start_codon:yes stop_codon:yes gene_type:complete